MKQIVAVTGLGALCGLGDNLKEIWSKLLQGTCGISKVEQAELGKLPIDIAGEVKNFKLSEEILPEKESSRYDRFILFSLHAAYEALEQAKLLKKNPYDPFRCGTIMGVGMGGLPLIERTHEAFMNRGYRRVSPFFIPSIIPSMSSGMISLRFGLKGVNYTASSACSSSAHAISSACQEIALGHQDMIVTGGAESVLSHLPFSGFINMKALSKRVDEPEKASRPFDKNRDGFVMGEGAGVIILENYESAKRRGATILGEISGFASSSDAHHITAPHPEGIGASQCMRQALSNANLSAQDIGYINAHGTSTPLGDIAETKAIKNVFGDHASKLSISSTKSMTGHLLGAAGGLETVFSLMALNKGEIPPTTNLANQDEKCDLNYTPNQSQKTKAKYALNNSFGFGGTNCSLIVKKG